MLIELINDNQKKINIIFNKNSNNKFKLLEANEFKVENLIPFFIESFIKNNITVKIDELKVNKLINFNKIKIMNSIYMFILKVIDFDSFVKEISLIILEDLILNNILNSNDVETRFLNNKERIINGKMLNSEENSSFLIKVKNEEIETDFVKILNNDGLVNISFCSEYIKDLCFYNEEMISIEIYKNGNKIIKNISVLNFFYDELNKCYFLSGKNEQ